MGIFFCTNESAPLSTYDWVCRQISLAMMAIDMIYFNSCFWATRSIMSSQTCSPSLGDNLRNPSGDKNYQIMYFWKHVFFETFIGEFVERPKKYGHIWHANVTYLSSEYKGRLSVGCWWKAEERKPHNIKTHRHSNFTSDVAHMDYGTTQFIIATLDTKRQPRLQNDGTWFIALLQFTDFADWLLI